MAAQVVLHPAAKTALGPTPYELEGKGGGPAIAGDVTTLGRPATDYMVETEALYTGRVAFVLGRRGKNYTNPTMTGPAQSVPFRQANQLAQFAVGGADVNTMQRMCSFEYLQRYFHYVLRTKTITIGANTDIGAGDDMNYVVKSVKKTTANVDTKYKDFDLTEQPLTKIDGKALLNAVSTMRYSSEDALNTTVPELARLATSLENSGIYAGDDGPFLRGKTLENGLVMDGSGKPRKDLPYALGDIVAFERLQQLIAENGACDWVPDGIVHSKLSQGDTVLDDELDSRDGQLYNVTVGGGAITSSWTNDKLMEVMPLDKVFVVIVADVWDGANKAAADGAHAAGYEDALLKAANRKDFRSKAQQKTLFAKKNATMTITNMRVRLTTSSEMIGCSALKDRSATSKSKFPARGTDADASTRAYYNMERDRHSRMGLKLSGDGGVSEYIIGGWCIGTVLDSAAARSSMDGVSLVGAVKRQRTAHASNIKVNVEWWSADKMHRSFMNVGGRIRQRHNGIANPKLAELVAEKENPREVVFPSSQRPAAPPSGGGASGGGASGGP